MAERERIEKKLGDLERYLQGLDQKSGVTEEEFLEDRDIQDIVERRFEKAIQASLDIASHLVSSEGFREPEDYGDLFTILREEEILQEELAEKMVEMAGFRNVLAHEYSNILSERVFQHLQDLERLRRFARKIQDYLDQS